MAIPTSIPLAVAAALIMAAAAFAPVRGATVPDTRIDISESAVAAQLPGQLVFADHMGTAQIAPRAAPLTHAGTPANAYQAGDVAYWEGDQSIVIFLADGAAVPTGGVTLIGRVTQGMGELTGCIRDCVVQVDPAAR